MAIPLILMAAGTAIQVAGQMSQNAAQAATSKQNALFYEEQAQYARVSALRAASISEVDWTGKYGQTASAYAGGGVDLSGSAGLQLAGVLKQSVDDLWAIKTKGDLDVKLARLRGNQADDTAAMLSSTSYNALQAGTAVLNNFAKSDGFGMTPPVKK